MTIKELLKIIFSFLLKVFLTIVLIIGYFFIDSKLTNYTPANEGFPLNLFSCHYGFVGVCEFNFFKYRHRYNFLVYYIFIYNFFH